MSTLTAEWFNAVSPHQPKVKTFHLGWDAKLVLVVSTDTMGAWTAMVEPRIGGERLGHMLG